MDDVLNAASKLLLDSVERQSKLLRARSALDELGANSDEIECIDGYEKVLLMALQGIQERLWHRLIDTRRRRNSLSSIHRLPEELFIAIFRLMLQGLLPKEYFLTLSKISGVSSVWRGMVNNSPTLWDTVHSRLPAALLKVAFERSCNTSLKVRYLGGDVGAGEIENQIVHHMGRLQSLTAESLSFRELSGLVRSPASMLEYLDLRHEGREGVADRRVVDLFGGQAGRLRHVVLSGIPVRWESQALSGLRYIDVCDIQSRGPSPRDVLLVLSRSPELEHFSLSRVTFSTDNALYALDSKDPLATGISLPHLTTLRLDHLSSTCTEFLLKHIHVPACRTLSIDLSESDRHVQLSSFAKLEKALSDTFRSAKDASFIISPNMFRLRVRETTQLEDSQMVLLKVPVSSTEPWLAWCTQLLEPVVERCQISVYFAVGFAFPDPAIFSTLARLNISKLSLQTLDNINPMIEYLGRTTNNGTISRWSLPNLDTLIIDAVFNGSLLVEILKKRYGLGPNDTNDPQVSIEQPARLVSITFFGDLSMDEEIYDDLEAVFDASVVEWDP